MSAGSGSIIDLLVKRQAVTNADIEAAKAEAKNAGKKLERFLVDNEIVSELEMTLTFSEYLNIPPINLTRYSPPEHLMDLIPKELMARHRIAHQDHVQPGYRRAPHPAGRAI